MLRTADDATAVLGVITKIGKRVQMMVLIKLLKLCRP
jgi:hypothetical protein